MQLTINAYNLVLLLGSILTVSAALDLSKCKNRAALCCFSKREPLKDGIPRKPSDNTYICSVKGSVEGYVADEEGPTHCHGLSWTAGDLNDRFKNDLLTHINFTDHYTRRKYFGGIASQPDCNCLGEEEDPVVSRADCSYVKGVDAYGKPQFESCNGPLVNDLRSYMLMTDPQNKVLSDIRIEPH